MKCIFLCVTDESKEKQAKNKDNRMQHQNEKTL